MKNIFEASNERVQVQAFADEANPYGKGTLWVRSKGEDNGEQFIYPTGDRSHTRALAGVCATILMEDEQNGIDLIADKFCNIFGKDSFVRSCSTIYVRALKAESNHMV